VEAFRREDPPATHKLAVPVSLPTHLIKTSLATKSPKHAAVADLATIAFYYLLRVGEYTFVRASKKRRTKTFRVKDVTFFDSKGVVIPNTAPVDTLLVAAEATLTISNQKNGRRGSCIHHEANRTRSHVQSAPWPAASLTSPATRAVTMTSLPPISTTMATDTISWTATSTTL
jgi:hypothetical protein